MGRKPKAEAEKKSDIVKDRVGEKTDTEAFFSDAKRSYQRLKEKGRTDLIGKYIKTLSAMGMLDDEIEAAESCGEQFELFKERDYQDQLVKAMDTDTFDDDLLSDTDSVESDEAYKEDDTEDTDGEKIDYWDGGWL